LDPALIDALNAPTSWWRRFAEDPELFVAVRDGSVNVYSRGASLLKLSLRDGRLVGQLHPKYLLRPDADGYVEVRDGRADTSPATLINLDVTDPALLARAALPWSGAEKSGVHEVLRANETVLDVEAALVTPEGVTRRVDFVNLEARDGVIKLVFYEAKCFDNPELRARDKAPPVLAQLDAYEALLIDQERDVLGAYRDAIEAFLSLQGAALRRPSRDALMRQVRAGTRLVLDPKPRLYVFGFDADQRDGAAWGVHRAKLEAALGSRLLLRGAPGPL
jgi:hypothetical protein